MARQSFIWTVLPNGITSDGGSLRVSILLSPRLDPQGDPKKLASFFPDWEDWPKTLREAQLTATYNGQSVVVECDDMLGPNRVDDRLGVADSSAWKALFKPDLFVRPFAYQDYSHCRVLSYDTVLMTSMIEKLYGDLAKAAGGDLPLVSDIVDERTWRGLVSTVAELDRASIDPHTGLRDPRRQFERLSGEPGRASIPETLERFQLFHTPPATPTPRREKRADDSRIEAQWLEYKRTPLPSKEDLGKELDFHQIVAAMGSYPVLLRRLGLVVDLRLAPTSFVPSANAALSVSVAFPPGTLQITRTNDAHPVTRTRLSAQHFDAVSDPAAAFRIVDGLLDLDPNQFKVLQFDVDGAGLKVMNFARSLHRRGDAERRVDPVSRHEDRLGAPALRTGGLMLVHRNRQAFLKGRFGANKSGNAKLANQLAGSTGTTNDVPLFAEDLVRGYRVDVWDSMTAKWRSLCRRTAHYDVNEGAVVVAVAEEEGTVRLAATTSSDPTSNANLVYLHEALLTWSGWSLAAPAPGRSIRPDDSVDTSADQSEAELPPGIAFKSRFTPIKHSLPRLRYGRAYAMRARMVDLAGNSLAPQEEDFGAGPPAQASAYLRYEPVEAPVIALSSSGGTIERPREGESLARIAIRSLNDTPDLNAVVTSAVASRVAAPPRVSVRDAELHGKLDAGGKVDASTFNLLAHETDVDPRDPGAAIREVALPMQGPLDPEPVDTTFAVYEEGRSLTYLPDPLAQEVAARIFDHPNIADGEIITIPLYVSDDWPRAKPFRIEVYEDALDKPYFDHASRRLRVPLPKAVRARIRLSMKLAADALDRMGVFGLLNDAGQALQRDRALGGQHWMLTPWRIVEVVHAVQRPLISPQITSLSVLDRAPSETSARPLLRVNCSIDSTDRLDLFAEWHEPLDDAALADIGGGPTDRLRNDVAFAIKVTDAASYASRTLAKTGGFPDHTIEGRDAIGVNTGGAAPSHSGIPPSAPKAHEFHDTRYRRIEYWFDATTRFREFMPQSILTESHAGQTVTVETRIKVTGDRAVTWIPSSAPPPAPKVLYVVPTFGWARTEEADGRRSSWRRGGGLRVYLDRPWNVSGYGEMLGVVLPPAGFSGDPDVAPKGYPYKDYVTQWGNDPIWDSPFVDGIAPRRSHFPLARTAPDATGAWLPPNAPGTEKDQAPGPFRVTGLEPPRGKSRGAAVAVAPHDVFYDATRRLWYCDIEIDAGASYFPFIRLALARYQPISMQHAHLSNIVLADVMALAADRWLNVTPTAEANQRRVAIFGLARSNRAAIMKRRMPQASA